MFILGLTGSIGMGKTAAARQFSSLGIPVHDSDRAVHAVMGPGGAAVPEIAKVFPSAVSNQTIDRQVLGKLVFQDEQALRRLESILHPMVKKSERRFLGHHARRRTSAVVLDIPLLFETGGERRCDAVAVVTAPYREQRRRVLARPGMTEERFSSVLKHQIPDQIKRKKADFVIQSGLGFAYSLRSVRQIATVIRHSPGTHWPPIPFPRAR